MSSKDVDEITTEKQKHESEVCDTDSRDGAEDIPNLTHLTAVRTLDDLKLQKCDDEKCEKCEGKLWHCPICPTTRFKPDTKSRLDHHIQVVHWNKNVKCDDFHVLMCTDTCSKEVHYHCPRCSKKVIRQGKMKIHVDLNRCRQGNKESVHEEGSNLSITSFNMVTLSQSAQKRRKICIEGIYTPKSALKPSLDFGAQSHISFVKDVSDLELVPCDQCKFYHCPLCPANNFLPVYLNKVKIHMQKSHLKCSGKYKDVHILKCTLPSCLTSKQRKKKYMLTSSHWHCPLCKKKAVSRGELQRHLNCHERGTCATMDRLGAELSESSEEECAEGDDSELMKANGVKKKEKSEEKESKKDTQVIDSLYAVVSEEMLKQIPGDKNVFFGVLKIKNNITYTLIDNKHCMVEGSWEAIQEMKELFEKLKLAKLKTEEEVKRFLEANLGVVISEEPPEEENEEQDDHSENLIQEPTVSPEKNWKKSLKSKVDESNDDKLTETGKEIEQPMEFDTNHQISNEKIEKKHKEIPASNKNVNPLDIILAQDSVVSKEPTAKREKVKVPIQTKRKLQSPKSQSPKKVLKKTHCDMAIPNTSLRRSSRPPKKTADSKHWKDYEYTMKPGEIKSEPMEDEEYGIVDDTEYTPHSNKRKNSSQGAFSSDDEFGNEMQEAWKEVQKFETDEGSRDDFTGADNTTNGKPRVEMEYDEAANTCTMKLTIQPNKNVNESTKAAPSSVQKKKPLTLGNEELALSCPWCDTTVQGRRGLMKHFFGKRCPKQNEFDQYNTEGSKDASEGEQTTSVPSTLNDFIQVIKEAMTTVTDHFCPLCSKKFLHVKDATLHYAERNCKDIANEYEMLIKKTDRGYQCPYCEFENKTRIKVVIHLGRQHLEKTHDCRLCSRKFGSLTLLKIHHRVIHCTLKTTSVCDHCGKKMLTKYLAKHVRIVHDKTYIPKPAKISDTTLQCGFCSYNTRNPIHIEKHIKRRHSDKEHKCKECPASFGIKGDLHAHVKVVHLGQKPKTVEECPICKKSMLTKNVKTHIERVHEKVKPFQCGQCFKTFQTRYVLDCHLNTHLPVFLRKHKFLCATCGKTFMNKTVYNDHMNMHTGERPYVCKDCGKTYKHNSVFQKHKEVHMNVKYPCNECNASFTSSKYLENHKRKHRASEGKSCMCGMAFDAIEETQTHKASCTVASYMGHQKQKQSISEGKVCACGMVFDTLGEAQLHRATCSVFQNLGQSAEVLDMTGATILVVQDEDTSEQQSQMFDASLLSGKLGHLQMHNSAATVSDGETSTAVVSAAQIVDPKKSSETNENEEIQRYLCGYCQQLFVGMEEVQTHMVTVHVQEIAQDNLVEFTVEDDGAQQEEIQYILDGNQGDFQGDQIVVETDADIQDVTKLVENAFAQ